MNECEIRAFGLQRSGNHALICWITAQFQNRTWCFINDVRHGDFDPYRNFSQIRSGGFGESPDIETLRASDKDLLLYSYEDDMIQMSEEADLLASIFDPKFEAHKVNYLGASRACFDLLIIRDPYNFFASRLKKLDELTGDKNLDRIADNWKRLAKMAIEAETNQRDNFVVGNFNRWFADEEYRRQLCDRIGGEFNDEDRDQVHGFGGGSSFDGNLSTRRLTLGYAFRNLHKVFDPQRLKRIGYYTKRFFYSQPASQMKVTKRWEKMRGNPRFERIIRDPEIQELSHILFGEVIM